MRTAPYRVGIVGSGVAGATTAFLLARDGHHVTLLERATALRPIGAGVLLQCSGQEVLRRLGILDAVTAHAAPLSELHARHLSGRDLIRTRYHELAPNCCAYGVHRGVLFNAIYRLMQTQPVDIRLGREVAGRETAGNEVTLIDTNGGRHGPFDLVVAGDGSRSRLREALGFRASIFKYPHGALWITAPCTSVKGKLLQIVRGNRNLLGLLPLGDGLCSMYWGLPVADFARLRERGLPALKAEILSFSPEAAEILDFVEDFEQLILTSYRHVYLRRTHDANTIFIGDAAHAMSPHLGQGINLAMVDAWRLADCLKSAPNPAAALRAFARRQRDYLRYYATVTYLLSPFFQSDWSILGLGRDLALPWFPVIPWVKRQMLLTVTGQKGGFFRGGMVI